MRRIPVLITMVVLMVAMLAIVGEPCASCNSRDHRPVWSIRYPGGLLERCAEHAREGQARCN